MQRRSIQGLDKYEKSEIVAVIIRSRLSDRVILLLFWAFNQSVDVSSMQEKEKEESKRLESAITRLREKTHAIQSLIYPLYTFVQM